MSLKLNDTQVLTGEINMALRGIWFSDLRLTSRDNPFKAGDSVTLKTSDGSFSLKGTIAPDRVGEVLGVVYTRIIGGKGGMAKTATPTAFQNGLVSDVLNSLISDSGETLSNTIDSSVLNTSLSNWTIFQSPVAFQLNLLTNQFNWNWRFLEDGTLWVGAETYPNAPAFDYVTIDHDIINGFFPLGVNAPLLTPGYTLDGYKVSKVVHTLEEQRVRTKFYEPQNIGDRSALTAVNRIIDSKLAPIDFFAQYSATVDSQSSDMTTVDITPDDSRLPGMQKIPFSSNLGGAQIQFSGGKVFLGWLSGNPTAPYATMMQGSGENVQKMILKVLTELDLGSDATTDFALLGTSFNTALQTFLTALNTFVGAVVTPTGVATPAIKTTMQSAITALQAANILSTKVKLV